MSTRSTITVRLSSGKYKSVYCHWDGYPYKPGVGWMLRTHYNTQDAAEHVVSQGALKAVTKLAIDPFFDEQDNFGIGLTPQAAIADNQYGRQQYNWVWDGREWHELEDLNAKARAQSLTPATCKAAGCTECDGSCMHD